MKTPKLFYTLTTIVLFLLTIPYGNCNATETVVSVEPPTSTAAVNETFTVNITVSNVVDLWSWQVGMTFNPKVLECLSFEEGPFLATGAGPLGTLWMPGIINNTAGVIAPYYACTLTFGSTPVSGNGTLAYVTFRVKDYGSSTLHLGTKDEPDIEVKLIDPNFTPMPIALEDGYFSNVIVIDHSIVVDTETYHVITVSNSTVSDIVFEPTQEWIVFNVTGEAGTYGFCNVTIPKNFMRAEPKEDWVVLLDGENITREVTDNDTHSSVYFTYEFSSTRTVQIKGTWAVPEFPTAMIVPLLLMATLTAAILRKKVRSEKRRSPSIAK